MRYGRITELRESTHYTSNDGSPIIEVDHIKDLGGTMSRDGTFSRHITMTTTTAKQMCGWILRTFLTRETVPMLTLWKSLIRSKLECCSQLAVESFQKRRYPDAGTIPTKFHSENYWDGAAIVLGAITCPVYTLWKGDVRGTSLYTRGVLWKVKSQTSVSQTEEE